ncbi:hypothetical protein GWI33_022524 [Rhynchophorus ferrugineus]|uniref:Uncharacterized protein n=1 Tax=Rhynchophorus ferrugineus TaxID=354439 RepID=A0A834M2U3_RHYFE|nr:hypothetical protein GWI33_022524 [Rhynchophorus ferrugineus]
MSLYFMSDDRLRPSTCQNNSDSLKLQPPQLESGTEPHQTVLSRTGRGKLAENKKRNVLSMMETDTVVKYARVLHRSCEIPTPRGNFSFPRLST